MPVNDKLFVQRDKGPENGFRPMRGLEVNWHSDVVLALEQYTAYDTITFKKGDKTVTLPWADLAKRLGLDW